MQELIRILILASTAAAFVGCHGHGMYAQERPAAASLAGKWVLTMDTPHGTVTADLQMKQEGTKLEGTITAEHMGQFQFTGTVDGKKVSMSMEVPNGGGQKFGFSGTVDGDKMSGTTETGGNWKATR